MGFSLNRSIGGICAFTLMSACVPDSAFLTTVPLPPPNSDICVRNPNAEACNRDSKVSTPGIVTILFTISQIPQASATLILANGIKYASPVANPRILFLKDSATNGEDEGDSDYIRNTLLAGYDVEYAVVPVGGLAASAVADKDLVILSNPGFPLSDRLTLSTFEGFKGGVMLVGDDLAHGNRFSMDAFTGLIYGANGSSMTCNGNTYEYDNGIGRKYQIAMNTEFLPGIPAEYKHYTYGNDIDHTKVSAGTQVLAWATAEAGTCDIGQIPVVTRRPR